MLNRWWALLLLLSGTFSYAGKPVPKAQELFIPYWTSEPGWNTELQLRNNLPSTSLTVTPILRMASGQEIPLAPMTIPANDSISLLVSKAVREQAPDLLGRAGSYGSVVFRYTSAEAMALHARAIVMLEGHPIAVPIHAHTMLQAVAKSDGKEAASMEGIWWQPRAGLSDFLVISNSSEQKANGNLSLFDANGKGWTVAVVLSPHQTERLSLSDLLQKSGLSGTYGGIGVRLPPSSVDVVHFVYDETNGVSALMDMFRRGQNPPPLERAGNDSKQSTLRAPMLALAQPDPAVGLPTATVLQPTILVRNTTAKSISAEMALSWHGASGSGQAKLPNLQLTPFATQQLRISEMQSLLRIPNDANWALVTVTTDALPDDVIAIASSRDINWRYGVDAKFISGDGGHFSGGQWRIDANHNEIAVITNVGTKPTDALLTLHYNGGRQKYEMQKTIVPDDQMWVNLAQLVRQQVPDRKGSVLPLDVGSVTYDLHDLTPRGHNLIANELAVNNTFGFGAIPDCAECCTSESPYFDPSFLDMYIGSTDTSAVDQTDSCNGSVVNITFDGTGWGSEDTAVATLSTGAKATGVGVGSTYGFVYEEVEVPGECSCNKASEKVQLPLTVGPYQVEPIDINSQGSVAPGDCPTGGPYAGFVKYVTNQVQYANGSPYAQSGVAVSDVITTGSKHDLGSGTSTGTGTTTGDGSFQDQYSVCSAVCPGSSGETDALQTWSAGKVPLPHSNAIVYKCSSITIDGH